MVEGVKVTHQQPFCPRDLGSRPERCQFCLFAYHILSFVEFRRLKSNGEIIGCVEICDLVDIFSISPDRPLLALWMAGGHTMSRR